MAISQAEAKQLIERLIFDQQSAQSWAQDVWDMSPTLGETAAKLIEVFDAVVDCCPEEKLENLLQDYYQEQMPD
ncbi:MAG: hypothetical protein F6J97_19565 [Leptolyngbya sp. SIO4C1]|nr:hypothetical protein [Leptolyngbya sp. SIO4C1]